MAVIGVDNYRSCRNCNSKVSVINEFMGECNKYDAKIKLSKCPEKNVARVVLEDINGKEHKLSIFDQVINQVIKFAKYRIADSASQYSVPELLLSAPQLTYTISRKETMVSVST